MLWQTHYHRQINFFSEQIQNYFYLIILVLALQLLIRQTAYFMRIWGSKIQISHFYVLGDLKGKCCEY